MDQDPTATSPYMNARQAAAYLQIHHVTLYRLIAENKLPHLRLGTKGKILFNRAVLDKFLVQGGKK